MTPSLQTSAKKQQSISNFFSKNAGAPKPASKTSRPKPPVPLTPRTSNTSNGNVTLETDDHVSDLSGGEGDARTPSRHVIGTIQQDDAGCNDDYLELPARKRQRLSDPQEAADSVISAHDSHVPPVIVNKAHQPAASERTSKFVFLSSSKLDTVNEPEDDEDSQKIRADLHRKFVKKLGRPDSIAEIKRRNWQISEETENNDADEVEDAEEEASKPSNRGGRPTATKKGTSKLTPMEKQYLEIKKNHLDTIIIYEVGYKFKFFGEDARVAAKELSIVCIPGRFRYDEHPSEAHLDRFASASIPVHRLHVHVKRLVAAGHKVGVVRQIETAALKAAGDNRNAPFVRKLTNLYTKGTYIDDVEGLEGPVGAASGGAPATGYLVCITEANAKGWGTDEKVHVGMIAVQPATGDIVHDDFEDGFMRSEIETRLLHIAPCEILIVGDLSKATEKLVQHLAGSKTNVFGDKVRLERVEKQKTMTATAYSHVSNFYAEKMRASDAVKDEKASKLLDNVLKLGDAVTICLSAMITHLSEYGLEHVFDLTKYFQSFSARSHMLLNGTTLTSLEIFQNQTDHMVRGSLFWTLDRTKTRFGQRLLRKWVGRPLLLRSELEERVGAVQELKDAEQAQKIDKITHLLAHIKNDLEKSLIRIYYGKCTRPELLTVLQTMHRIANEFGTVKHPADAGFKSDIINSAIAALPIMGEDVVTYLEQMNPEAAREDDKYAFFREEMESEDITEHKLGIASVEHELDAHRAVAAEKVRKKRVEFVTVAGIEYLVEIENTQLKNVPASWAKISGTKKVSRFHTPEVVKMIRERDQHKEALAAACDVAFTKMLADISSKYQVFRDCVHALATLDCLLSLAAVAGQPGYVMPEYVEETRISLTQGRHPMVEQLLLDSYVPNDTHLASDQTRALLITGPNMGGKSSYVRQVALIAIMGQIGSYVPADSARLGLLDAVFTRMGAFDNMMAGESTFMVELSETADVLKQATSRSLVILDELGRGTSTHDGVAIAQAVLDYVIRDRKSLTLFITHYQNLSALARGFEHGELKNVHMRFTESGEKDQDITFLYEIGEGVAHRSYGLNVARLANVPDSVLWKAAIKSKELEDEACARTVGHLSTSLSSLLANSSEPQLDDFITEVGQLQ